MTDRQTTHLSAVLRSLIAGNIAEHALAGGITLRYRVPDGGDQRHRLLAFRASISLTTGELATVRQALESAIGQPALPAEPWRHAHLTGYLLPWLPVAQQGALALDVPALPASPYQE